MTNTAAPDGESPLDVYEATLFHIELIAKKRKKLLDVQLDAERQVLHRAGRDHAAGLLSYMDLRDLYERYRQIVGYDERPGYSTIWNESIEVSHVQLTHWAKSRERYVPNEDGSWSGEYPIGHNPRPPDGQSVVYVLFDAENVPCYVGSTHRFKHRLLAHRRDKRFVRWAAYPCDDRETAYQLEERLLREHKPYLNKRAGR